MTSFFPAQFRNQKETGATMSLSALAQALESADGNMLIIVESLDAEDLEKPV